MDSSHYDHHNHHFAFKNLMFGVWFTSVSIAWTWNDGASESTALKSPDKASLIRWKRQRRNWIPLYGRWKHISRESNFFVHSQYNAIKKVMLFNNHNGFYCSSQFLFYIFLVIWIKMMVVQGSVDELGYGFVNFSKRDL